MIEICLWQISVISCLRHGDIETFGFGEIRQRRMKYLPAANVKVSDFVG